MAFQALSWECMDLVSSDQRACMEAHETWKGYLEKIQRYGGDQDDDRYNDEPKPLMELNVCIFGRDADGKSVCARVLFQPYFFVEAPEGWDIYDSILLGRRLYVNASYSSMGSLVSIQPVHMHRFNGFRGDVKVLFYKCVFRTERAASACAKRLLGRGYKVKEKEDFERVFNVYESNVDPSIRLMHVRGLKSTGWMSLQGAHEVPNARKISHCDREFLCTSDRISDANKEELAPVVMASFDIECHSVDGSFPDHQTPGCAVIQIATTLERYGEDKPFKRHLVTLKTCAKLDCDAELESYQSEREVLEAWAKFLRRHDVDVLLGYNIVGFDEEYMMNRAVITNCGPDFYQNLSKVKKHTSKLESKTMSSAAYGHNAFHYFSSPGILQMDVLTAVKREFKLDSYKLDRVAEHFLGERKIDLPPKEIFAAFAEGTPESIKRIGDYAVKDTELPLRLVNKLNLLVESLEMAKTAKIPFQYLLERGQGIRVYSLVLDYAMQRNFAIQTRPYKSKETPSSNAAKVDEDETYVGATVLEPKSGAYMEVPISCLDFASLYPSIIRAMNMCHTTIVLDPKYDDAEGAEYNEVAWEENGRKVVNRFVKSREGILPAVLTDLAAARKRAKKQMADAPNQFSKSLFDGKQKAIKVMMNSIYGATGASTGYLPCKQIASSVTAYGRQMILKTKEFVESNYEAEVVYGDTDSVFCKFKPEASMEDVFRVATEAADRITQIFQAPIEIEFEKVYSPLLLFKKKRYAGLMYTRPDKPDKIDSKGIQLVRRDVIPYVRDVSKKVLNSLMYDRNIVAARMLARDSALDLMRGKVPIEKLVLSKSLQKSYKNNELPHIAVTAKMNARDPGSGAKPGDRVPYVFVEVKDPKAKQVERAEDPGYVREKGLKLDYAYYLQSQFVTPLFSLLELVIDGKDAKQKSERLFGDILRTARNAGKKQREITSFFSTNGTSSSRNKI